MWAIDLIREGGFIMGPLLLCSILIWAVAIERWIFLKKFNVQSLELYRVALPLVKNSKFEEIKDYSTPLNKVTRNVYLNLIEGERGSEIWGNNIQRKFEEASLGLKKYLWILGTIGNLAPFIGLFGTVVGIIKSFESISVAGKSGFHVVSAGLAEALIATAAGIIVAVVSVIFFNYFQTRVKNTLTLFKNEVEELKDIIKAGNSGL